MTGGPSRPYEERTIPFVSGDGFPCNLIHIGSEKASWRGPVILVHGAGVRANIFRAPLAETLVDALVEHGYDVWLENWRASIDHRPNPWTLDQAALFDHPAAVRTIVEQTGADRVKAVIHCQGSTSFTMSLMAGLLPQVSTVVSNAVSLVPIVPEFSRRKLRFALPMLHRMVDYLNPHWGVEASTWQGKLIRSMVRATHHECDNDVCRLVSFTYGSGFPALWRHENLNEPTHEWLKTEFAEVPLTFFDQIWECIKAGRLVSVEGRVGLPKDFIAQPPQTSARIAFFAGSANLCFLPESQQRAFEFFERSRPNYHKLHIIPSYSHLDIFMGKDASRDIFPLMLSELDREESSDG